MNALPEASNPERDTAAVELQNTVALFRERPDQEDWNPLRLAILHAGANDVRPDQLIPAVELLIEIQAARGLREAELWRDFLANQVGRN